MQDLIERQAAIDAFDTQTWGLLNAPISKAIRKAAQETIKQLPPAQPEIIHCRECKHRDKDGECGQYDDGTVAVSCEVPDDHYCGYAERRTDE